MGTRQGETAIRIRFVGDNPLISTVRRSFAGIVVGMALLWTGYQVLGPSGYMALREREREAKALQEELQKLTVENIRLSAQIDALNHDSWELERIARQELKLARPGEIVFVLPQK